MPRFRPIRLRESNWMQKLVGVIVVFILLLISNEALTTNDGFKLIQFEFELDTTKDTQIGYRPGTPGIGPKSISLGKECVYIVDDYHFNLKRIDLKTGALTSSQRVSSREYCWPNDAIECSGNVLVSDSFDSVFVFDTNLNRLRSTYVGEQDNRFFIREEDGSLLLYGELHDAAYAISCHGEVDSMRDTAIQSAVQATAHGNPFSVVEQNGQFVLRTKYYSVPLVKGTENVSQALDYLDCSYVDYDSSRVVYFNILNGQIMLYYYQKTVI